MNSVYFFLPFILISSIGIYQDVFASESIRGYDYSIIKNPDGTHIWTGGLEPWILNNGQYVPFIFTDNTKTVETEHGSVKLNPDGSYSFYKKGRITETELFTDKIIAKYADMTNLNSWTYPNSINNDTPILSWNGNGFTSTKSAAIGVLDYKYILDNGKWKTQLEATNLSAFTNKAFGFDQIIDLNRDTIMFNGITRNLDNFNNTTLDKTWLTNNRANVIDFLNDVSFDFDLGFENLYSVTIIDTGINKSRLIFDYRTSIPLLPNNTLVIDPTYSSNNPTVDGVVVSDALAGAVCSTTAAAVNTGIATIEIYLPDSDLNLSCQRGYAEYDISSIPDGATILDSDFTYDIVSTPGSTKDCAFVGMTVNPTTGTADQIYDDILTSTVLTSSSTCTTAGDNRNDDLGVNGDSYIASALVQNWAAIGWRFNDETRVAAGPYDINFAAEDDAGAAPKPTLTVVYVTGSPPNPVTSMSSANITPTSADIIWVAPNDFGSGTFQNYTANYTSPTWSNNPTTFLGNTTSLFLNVTGLTFGTQYSFRVSAVTEIAYNTTGSYILNITTTSTTYPGTEPTQLYASSVLPTTITARWNPATIDAITGYQIEREAPIDSGWVVLDADTGTTTTNYNDTAVVTNLKYNYRVSAMNGTGFSAVSNEDDSYAYHIPDAVTDLTGSSTDFSTISLGWTAPTLYADLIGYRINFTTPEGDPVSILSPNPYTSGTTASILDLIPGSNYSFRVAPVTIFGANASGNIFNATTGSFLTPGDLGTGDITNTYDFQIFFDRDDINSTAIQVDVTYSDTYDLSCDLAYQLARTNQTYSNMTETVVSADEVESSFLFINATGDIIHIKCWDVNTGDEAMYVLTITDFPFLDQISNMRNGTYGTYFQIGAIDGVTLMICILAMIGFNRTNPIGGIIFLVITIGVLSFFQIITYPIVMYPALALLMVWGYISTRKDD